ncbi:GtrA family protein [Bacillus haynesii]|uniref:GtrA family protein n=1 Tax=Bacillus haynesii TaxID=1925021 RepID=UPI00227E0BC6|nr:GtrA family protein [Bacillus haynesii]MCY7816220.1 GtrA family protein [Bacillus haynesii]MCY8240753.1 GtrA family protein [Bacillus haynesii]MCY8566658.1 GtrA family protein [Bacillus haynesii]MCY8661058.1 GtrA family protein [Bacillus haynesii]MCY8670579.1 GtrA family protein [Bacillus haynesii]
MNKNNITTLVRFGTVGTGNTLVDFVVFFLLASLHIPYLAAQLFSYSAGVANSYIWNRTWTFQVKEKAHGAEIIRFIMINLAAAGATFVLLYIFQKAGLSLFVSKMSATVAGMAINYIGNRLWVFQEPVTDS